MFEKPETSKFKEKADRVYSYMLLAYPKYVSKQEIMRECNISNERTVREVISYIKKKKPVIATSDKRGYKLARKIVDLEEVIHTWKELDSRIEELELARRQLIRFKEAVEEYEKEKKQS